MDPDEIGFTVEVGGGPDGRVVGAPRGARHGHAGGAARRARAPGRAGRGDADLAGLRFMDTSGLRLILETAEASRRDGFAFAVLPGAPAVQRLFEVAGVQSSCRSTRGGRASEPRRRTRAAGWSS